LKKGLLLTLSFKLQACDLVVRFDFLHHMVGYVQSRGRARNKASTFVVMIRKDDVAQMAKYRALQESEPAVNNVYRTRHTDRAEDDEGEVEEDHHNDETHPIDLVERERYVVPSSKAILTYDNSLGLLNNLCALIPRDAFTPVHSPRYKGDFQVTLYLPRALPLPSSDLVYTGPWKRSKKEARRAVAFKAVMRLLQIDVFDEHLLPISKDTNGEHDTSDLKLGVFRRNIPCTLTVPVKEPWCMGWKLWIHPLVIDGNTAAGLVTGTRLAPVEVMSGPSKIWTLPAQLLTLEDLSHEKRVAMNEFTRYGILYTITGSPFPPALSFYLVPITPANRPDFERINRVLVNPYGNHDWSGISENDYGRLVFRNRHRIGKLFYLQRLRPDLSPMSTPAPGSREAGFSTYRDYWNEKWSRKNHLVDVPCDGPLLEGWFHSRSFMALYHMNPSPDTLLPIHLAKDGALLPQSVCLWLDIPPCVFRAFEVLPIVCHRITHVYRARCAQFELRLPPIPHDLLIEALTLPSATFPFNNQRLETLGDAVLQLCTTVHLLNHYPNRHEGQLTSLRQKVINNRYLLNCGLDIGLERFLISEMPSVHKWKYTLPSDTPKYFDKYFIPQRSATKKYPRRSLQDSMEALLGASFLAGGIPLALPTGTALGLDFGGPLPWFMRYANSVKQTPIAALFASLEGNLGYKFQHNHILLEALSHPSSVACSDFPSYQRLEFLGDGKISCFETVAVVLKYFSRP
jgi:endoribonuclease Dicer